MRFDNIRIRPFAFPEPKTTVGSERVIGIRAWIDNIPCPNVTPVDATLLYCTAPPHAPGWVEVKVMNPDEESDALANGLLYVNAPLIGNAYLPAARR